MLPKVKKKQKNTNTNTTVTVSQMDSKLDCGLYILHIIYSAFLAFRCFGTVRQWDAFMVTNCKKHSSFLTWNWCFLSLKLLVWKKNKCFYFEVICAISNYCVFPLMLVSKYMAVRFAHYCAPLDVVTDKCPMTLH